MGTKAMLEGSSLARVIGRKPKQKGSFIDLTRVMEIKQAHRRLEKNCRVTAEVAEKITQDLEECCSDIKEVRKDLSHLNGAIIKNGIAGIEES